MAVAKQSYTFRDSKGNTARISFFVSGANATAQATAANNVFVTITPLTNAAFQSSSGPETAVPTEVVYGTSATYENAEDKAVFTFQTAAGGIHRYQIPAPIAGMFLADGETVDNSNVAVTAFVSAVIANVVDRNGNPVAFGANGVRARRKLHRKLSIFTKNPTLTGPGE
jgi:hypothetical protein